MTIDSFVLLVTAALVLSSMLLNIACYRRVQADAAQQWRNIATMEDEVRRLRSQIQSEVVRR